MGTRAVPCEANQLVPPRQEYCTGSCLLRLASHLLRVDITNFSAVEIVRVQSIESGPAGREGEIDDAMTGRKPWDSKGVIWNESDSPCVAGKGLARDHQVDASGQSSLNPA